MTPFKSILIMIICLVILFFVIKFLRMIFRNIKIKRGKKILKRSFFLSARAKVKSETKYENLLMKFRKKYKREPSKNEMIKMVITASHHTFPVRGRNVRRWTKGQRGHWNRQKVRKYLLEKHNIIEKYNMK